MCEVGCLFTLLESGDQRCKKGTRDTGGEKVGIGRALQGKARREKEMVSTKFILGSPIFL